jgi:hypothetical protein
VASCAVVCPVVAGVLCSCGLSCGCRCPVQLWFVLWLPCPVVCCLPSLRHRTEAEQVRRPRRPARTDCARRRMDRACAHAAPQLPTARAAIVLLSKERQTASAAAEQGAESRSRGSATPTTRHPPQPQCPPQFCTARPAKIFPT